MELVRTEEFFKSVAIEETGETQNVLEYTMRYTYNVETIATEIEIDGIMQPGTQEVETLLKTERIDEYGVWLIDEHPGFINFRMVEPTQKYIDEHPEDFLPKNETQEEKIARLEAETLAQAEKLTRQEQDILTATEGVITLYEMILAGGAM